MTLQRETLFTLCGFVVVVLRLWRKLAALKVLKQASGARSGPRAVREVRLNRLVLT